MYDKYNELMIILRPLRYQRQLLESYFCQVSLVTDR